MLWSTILKQLALAAIPLVVDIGRKLFDKFDKIGSEPSMTMNQKNTVSDVEQIGKALGELREHVINESKPAVDKANDSIMSYVEEQLFILEGKAELLSKYKISSRSVEHNIKDIERRTSSFWRDAIHIRISLDNLRCREILMMPSGEKKVTEIAKFTNEVLAESLNEYAELVRSELENLYTDFEEEVAQSVSRLENTVTEYSDMVKSLDEKDDDKFEQLMAKAHTKIFCYDAILEKAGV